MIDLTTAKPIEDCSGRYLVDPEGNVYSLVTHKEIRQHKFKKGYVFVRLYKEPKHPKNFAVHRLVAKAFIPNPDNLPCVNHKDENKENNCISNLEWCTDDYNRHYGTGAKRQSDALKKYYETHTNPMLGKPGTTAKPIVATHILSGKVQSFPSARQAGIVLGIRDTSIGACCRGQRKTAGGYRFRFEVEEEDGN